MLENNQENKLVLLKDLGMMYATETSVKKYRYGFYKCYCGNEFESMTSSVKSGNTKSCGCLQIEKFKQIITKHNLSSHRLYNTWDSMVQRCYNIKNKKYKDYGGRGITVCDEWLNIQNFIDDMYPIYQDGLTLDRIDNNLGYSPDNCRWASKAIQSRNQRKLMITNTSGYKGVSLHKKTNRWRVRISVNKKEISLGYFDTAINGALAYDKYIIDNKLEHTRNF